MANIKRFEDFSSNPEVQKVAEDFTGHEEDIFKGLSKMDKEQLIELRDREEDKLKRLSKVSNNGTWDSVQDQIEACIETIEGCDHLLGKEHVGYLPGEAFGSKEKTAEVEESENPEIKSHLVDREKEIAFDDEPGEIEVTHYMTDDNGLEFYKDDHDHIFAKVNGEWHICTPEGEPDYAIRNNVIVK